MLTQLKEYMVNLWIDSPITFSKNQAIVLVILLAALGFYFYNRSTQKPAVIKESFVRQKSFSDVSGGIVVDVSGEVEKPGVYTVKSGSRLLLVVEKAGGLNKNADRNAINLAMKMEDGQKVVIPSKIPEGGGSTASKLININTADAKELEELPGIGETIAERIVAKREADGPFKKVEELNDVEGVGPKKFEQMKDSVSVY